MFFDEKSSSPLSTKPWRIGFGPNPEFSLSSQTGEQNLVFSTC